MPTKRKFTEEEIRARRNESTRRWEKNNPDKVKARNDRAAKTRREKRTGIAATKTCSICAKTKPRVEFNRHGIGFSDRCLKCVPVVVKKNPAKRAPRPVKSLSPKVKVNGYDALEKRLNGPGKAFKLRSATEDWTFILGSTEGGMTVWHRDGILKFLRPDRTFRFGVMMDDTGGSWRRLEDAEKVRNKLWRSLAA